MESLRKVTRKLLQVRGIIPNISEVGVPGTDRKVLREYEKRRNVRWKDVVTRIKKFLWYERERRSRKERDRI